MRLNEGILKKIILADCVGLERSKVDIRQLGSH